MPSLPLIDISPLYQDDDDALRAVAQQIDQACREWGFFYITGHPITQARIDAVLGMMKDFYALPLQEKLQIDITHSPHHRGYGALSAEQLDPAQPGDYKETFNMGFHMPEDHPDVLAGKPLRGPNRHPDIAGWQTLMDHHYRDMHALSLTLLRALAVALGAGKDFFDARFHEPISVLRTIHYPPRPEGSGVVPHGAGAHTDYGCVTLLYQDKVGGLQVRNAQGEWIDAPSIDGSFVVNIGDMMARWSNDRYKSTLHRVVSPHGADRYSMPFFAEPNPDTVIDCLPGCFDADSPPKYQPTTCSAYMLGRFAETYAHRRTEPQPAG
ncbi:2OG-Fe(II) oxygenase [Corticibacter populi]|uniref:2-oxoglutarate-dependent ethylene/succinate-forming enzyme n=1 Tax=Corticibacter populi TaxID=1550736 RepID=A0A3M6QP97_9BURK|nr:2-oxoglutarate and iron-dependent oxygenase domain-containing protein [Corticibacter populi]RMX04893.1 2OG-Fe(II) oxygenase [Corticibacter populi]RZS33684.1 isopenicillin N synthase-like dioxygenase [Corticibacter populi]